MFGFKWPWTTWQEKQEARRVEQARKDAELRAQKLARAQQVAAECAAAAASKRALWEAQEKARHAEWQRAEAAANAHRQRIIEGMRLQREAMRRPSPPAVQPVQLAESEPLRLRPSDCDCAPSSAQELAEAFSEAMLRGICWTRVEVADCVSSDGDSGGGGDSGGCGGGDD